MHDGVPKREHYVYILYREDGVTPFYVGLGKRGRWLQHEQRAYRERSHKAHIIRDMKARGVPIVKRKVAENLTRPQAVGLEISLIAAIGRKPKGPLTNITAGGDGVADVVEETRRKVSERVKRQMADPQARARISAALKGHGFREESIAKMRATRGTPEWRAKASERSKRIQSDPVVREKIRVKLLGSKRTLESRAKMSEAAKRRKATPEARANMVRAQQLRRAKEAEQRIEL